MIILKIKNSNYFINNYLFINTYIKLNYKYLFKKLNKIKKVLNVSKIN